MKITILTPTYNRAHLLPNLFESLCRQTCQDFEWIVVDDGSTDDTQSVVAQLDSERNASSFSVRYFKKLNGGKHTAVNYGVKQARGELTLILDSDDELPPNAVADVQTEWFNAEQGELIEKGDGTKPLGGICGYMAHRNGDVISKPMIRTICDEFKLWYVYHVNHDMCEVFRTDVLREFPFPEIKGERFCPEDLIWGRIAKKYSLLIFPKVIYYRDYLEGGLTDNIVRIRMNSPVCAMMRYAESTTWPYVSFVRKVRNGTNYWRFWFCRDKGARNPKLSLRWYWTRPLGWLLHQRDLKNVHK